MSNVVSLVSVQGAMAYSTKAASLAGLFREIGMAEERLARIGADAVDPEGALADPAATHALLDRAANSCMSALLFLRQLHPELDRPCAAPEGEP